ncbi:MAG: glycosyltransferase [Sulfobacillus sp.]
MPTRSLTAQITRFVLVGAANTLIDFGLFDLLSVLLGARSGLLLAVVNIFSVTVAMIFSYWANGRFTFGVHARPRAFSRFAVITGASLVLNTVVVLFVAHLIANPTLLDLNLAKASAVVLSGTINFLGYRFFVYREPRPLPAMARTMQSLAVVIPAFNEQHRLPRTLDILAKVLPQLPIPYELIIVDDGSTDQTAAIVRRAAESWPQLRLISLRRNYGKGRAVRVGIGAARSDVILYTDADHSVDITQWPLLTQALEQGAHLALGVRPDPDAGQEGASAMRRLMSHFYRRMVANLLLPGYPDPQCGFKAMWRDQAPLLLSRAAVDGFSFDVEFLIKAERHGMQVAQVPITWEPQPGSTVRPLIHAPRTMLELVSLRTGVRDTAGFLAILLALADVPLRLWNLWLIPRIGDEWGEIFLAYRIYRGQVLPLTDTAHDIGALYNYLLAGLFHIFGPSLDLPRLFVMLLSVVTVYLTFLIGRMLFGRWIGLFAAALLATSAADILTTHMAWSNTTDPFFVTLAAYLLMLALHRGRWWYVAAGLVWGLALQTHGTVVALLPAPLIAIALLGGRRRLKDPWLYGGFFAFLVGYLNMIIFNIRYPLASLRWVAIHNTYALSSHLTIASYLRRLTDVAQELIRSLASQPMLGYGYLHTLPPPMFWLMGGLLVIGLVILLREREVLLAALLTVPLLADAVVGHSFYFPSDVRYIAPLLPFAYLAIAVAAARLWSGLRRRLDARRSQPLPIGWLGPALALLIVVLPIPALSSYYQAQLQGYNTNAQWIQVAAAVHQVDPTAGGPAVLVDSEVPFGRYLPLILQVEGERVITLGNPYANRDHGSFSLTAWRSAISQHPGGWALLTPEDFHTLRPYLGGTAASFRELGRGYFVLVHIP